MAASTDWTRDKGWDVTGGSGEQFGMPGKGKLYFKYDGTTLEISELKDTKDTRVICDWWTASYTFSDSTCEKVQGSIGSSSQTFTIVLRTVTVSGKTMKVLRCDVAPSPLTWLKKLLKALIHTAVGDAGSWTAIEGG